MKGQSRCERVRIRASKHLRKSLPLLEPEHVFVVERPLQNLLDSPDDKAQVLRCLQTAIDLLAIARYHASEVEQVRKDRNAEHCIVDATKIFTGFQLWEPHVEQAAEYGKAVEKPSMWVPACDVCLVCRQTAVLEDLERTDVVQELQK